MLTMLVNKTMKASTLRNDTPQSRDILTAMIEIGLIKSDDHDEYNTKSVTSFKNWLDSTSNTTVNRLNQVPSSFKKTIVENRKFDQDIDEQDEKLKKLKQKQDFYNNFNNMNNDAIKDLEFDNKMNVEEEEDLDFKLHWLDYLIEKDYKYNRKKYENTIFSDNVHTGDYLIDNENDRVNGYLPINIKYEE